jgi:hypothetical protein
MLARRIRRIKEAQRFYARNAVKTTLVLTLCRSGRPVACHHVVTPAQRASGPRRPSDDGGLAARHWFS